MCDNSKLVRVDYREIQMGPSKLNMISCVHDNFIRVCSDWRNKKWLFHIEHDLDRFIFSTFIAQYNSYRQNGIRYKYNKLKEVHPSRVYCSP